MAETGVPPVADTKVEEAANGPAAKKTPKTKQPAAGQLPVGSPEEGVEGARRSSATLIAFAVQCAQCMKWRKVPTLEQYEDIRATISQSPFVCSTSQPWHQGASCDDPADLEQDSTLLWAMDRQDIPRPPAGWRRRIVVRGGTSNKFSDVYYHTPTGKSLRSMNDVEKFLAEHPEFASKGITKDQFSFASPRPLTSSAKPKKVTPGSTPVPGSKRPAGEGEMPAAKHPGGSEPASNPGEVVQE